MDEGAGAVDMSDAGADGRTGEAPSGVSRRGFLQAAGAVGLAATAGSALFGAQPARATTGQIPFLGSYEGVPGGPNQWFDDIKKVVPLLNGYRQYDPAQNYPTQDPKTGIWQNHFASQWPDDPYTGYAGPSVFSIYVAPSTVTGSQATQTKHDIMTLMTSAKNPHSYLSAWHEFGNIDYGAYGVTADNLKEVHNFLCGIAALPQFPNVAYGPILFAPKVHDYNYLVAAFQSCPSGMGFYGVDVYGNNGTSAGLSQLDNFIDLAMPLDPHNNPQLIIAETNAPLSETLAFKAGETGIDLFTAPNSSFIDGQPVKLEGAFLPPGFSAGVTYYVLNASGDSFMLSDTSFGPVHTLTGFGEGVVTTLPAPRAGGVGTGWFESVCSTMHNYGPKALGVLTYWNVNGALSGGWEDPDGTTAAALNNCINNVL
jgi:hypothetical protein